MTAWSVRHEGSPKEVELSQEQLLEGLRDGHWEPTDEVRGPGEKDWLAIENHPVFAEVAAELSPPPPREHDDETRLDMNALIDVTLVLLIFFILTTSYAALSKRIEAPTASKDKKLAVPVFTKEKIEQQLILVTAKMEGGRPVIRVESKEVELPRLTAELRSFARSSGKAEVLLDHDGDVPHHVVVQIIDKAKMAGIARVRVPVP
jgi:biopolymer transport protein ExbD